MKKIYTLLFIALTTASVSGQVVISQVYGGGGNNGAPLNRDYVELYNRGTTAIDMSGWSIQYNSATGVNAWNINVLPAGATIQPSKYYLIAFGAAGANGVALPTPDFDSTTGPLNLSGTSGKLILVNIATALPAGGCTATPTQTIDAVSFGPTATCFEGTGPAPILSNSLAAFRKANGCTDTNDNAEDFVALTPAPRNGASAAGTCAPLAVSQNSISGLRIYPNPVSNGTLFIETAANAEKTVTVYDVLGKKVLNTKTTDTAINISSLHTGVYIVNITEEGKTASRKLVIR